MIKRTLSTGTSINLYYRYTCEKCGYNSHWIEHRLYSGASESITFRNEQNLQAVADGLSADAKNRLEASISFLEAEMRECFDGKQAGTKRSELINVFRAAQNCPKCGGAQSWFPVQKLMQRAADKYNAATPVLSEPDVLFGNEIPEESHDLSAPCRIEIIVNAPTFSATSAWMALNTQSLGEFRNGTVFTAQTGFKDNILRVTNLLGTQLLAYYFEAKNGESIKLRFTGRSFDPC